MSSPIHFTDKATLLYKEWLRTTPNGNSVYMYIFARVMRLDTTNNTWHTYSAHDNVKMVGPQENIDIGDHRTIHYTRVGKSWDFKLLSVDVQ